MLAPGSKLRALLERAPVLEALDAAAHGAQRRHDAVVTELHGETGLDLRDARVRAGFTRGHLLELIVYSRAFVGQPEALTARASRALVSRLLERRLCRDWLSEIRGAPLAGSGLLRVMNSGEDAARAFPLHELPSAVCAAIRGLYAGLPERACCDDGDGAEWTLFELEPEPAEDYAAQDDLVLASCMRPELLKCYLQGQEFCSERFSRHRELFCYLKYESRHASPSERLAERCALEDALNAELRSAARGGVIGSGLGVRYTYLDLALIDVDRGLERARAVARRHGLGERAWILFCDTELEREWIGIQPGAPLPVELS